MSSSKRKSAVASHFHVCLEAMGVSLGASGPPLQGAECASIPGLANRLNDELGRVGRVDEFISGLEEHMATEAGLLQLLLPMVLTKVASSPGAAKRPRREEAKEEDIGDAGGVAPMSICAPPQPTLAKVLLGVDRLQTKVASLLLQRIPETAHAEQPRGVAQSMSQLLLLQLRWLDYIVDSKAFTATLLEAIGMCPKELKREIITCLPEIMDDTQHGPVVDALQECMREDVELTVVVLDALSNLNLSPRHIGPVIEDVLDGLASAKLADVPVQLRFLLTTTSADNVTNVVRHIRQNLPVQARTSGARPVSSAQRRPGSFSTQEVEELGQEALLLEVLNAGLKFRADVTSVFIKALGRSKGVEEHHPVDIWLLSVVHSMAHNAETVQRLIKAKVVSGDLDESLLRRAIVGHGRALRAQFKSLLAVASFLLRCRKTKARAFGTEMFRILFLEMCDAQAQQEVVHAIITHAGSGIAPEVDSAFCVLVSLVRDPLAAGHLKTYTALIKGMLDFVGSLEDRHVRQLYDVLVSIAYLDSPVTSHHDADADAAAELMTDQLTILLRKQLTHGSARHKRIGIIGTVVMMTHAAVLAESRMSAAQRALESQDAEEKEHAGSIMDNPSQEEESEFEPHTEKLVELQEMVDKSCKNSGLVGAKAMALFYDELCRAIEGDDLAFPAQAVAWLSESISAAFETHFLGELGEGDGEEVGGDRGTSELDKSLSKFVGRSVLNGAVKCDLIFNIDGDEANVLLNLLPIMANSNPRVRDSVHYLCPLFRCLVSCEMATNDGGLGEIDACLGAPVVLFSFSEMFDEDEGGSETNFETLAEPMQHRICWTLLHCLNWLRGLVNAFAAQEELEMRTKVMKRVEQLFEVEVTLKKACELCPSFAAQVARDVAASRSEHIAGRASYQTKGRIPSKAAKVVDDDDDTGDDSGGDGDTADDQDENSSGPKMTSKKKKKKKKKRRSNGKAKVGKETAFEVVRKVIRPLNPTVAAIIGYRIEVKELDTQEQTEQQDIVRLPPHIMARVMQEACSQIKLALRPKKKLRFGQVAMSAENYFKEHDPSELTRLFVPEVFPSMSAQLQRQLKVVNSAVGAVVEDEEDQGDDCGDGNSRDEAEGVVRLIVDVLHAVSSNKQLLADDSGKDLVRDALKAFAPGGEDVCADSDTLAVAAGEAFSLLEPHLTDLPKLESVLSLLDLFVQFATLQKMGGDKASARQTETTISLKIGELLTRDWFPSKIKDKGTHKKAILGRLIRLHLELADKPLERLEYLAVDQLDVLVANPKETVPTLKTLNKKSFVIFFESFFIALVKLLKSITWDGDMGVALDATLRIAKVFSALATTTKTPGLDAVRVLSILVRHGRVFIEAFCSTSLTYLFDKDFFREHTDAVLKLIKYVQAGTRQIHHICAHSKIKKKDSIAKNVPKTREALSAFLYSVKEQATKNNVHKAIVVGNLKHRDVHGALVQEEEDDDDDSASDSNSASASASDSEA